MPPEQKIEPVPTMRYAGFWLRLLASVLDSICIAIPLSVLASILLFILIYVTGEDLAYPTIGFSSLRIVISFTQYVLVISYYVIAIHRRQATIGKRLLGLRVVSVNGTPLSVGRIIRREIGKIVSALLLGIGFLMAGFTSKKQTLHDMMAGAVVVSNPDERKKWAFVLSIIVAAILPLIAVLGILASVVLASLNVARGKALDAYAMSKLRVVAVEAEMVRNTSNSYLAVCSDSNIISSITPDVNNRFGQGRCESNKDAYLVYIPPTDPSITTVWCVDSVSTEPKKSEMPQQGSLVCTQPYMINQ